MDKKMQWAVSVAGALIMVLFISVSMNSWHTVAASTPSDAGFSDIDASTYKDAILFVQSQGIVEGYSDGTFRPDIEINRAEFTKIMVEGAYQEEVETYQPTSCFPDVNATDWFAKYVCLAKDHGVIGGYPDGNFQPAQNINVAESLKITMLAMFGEEIDDVSSGDWYQKYLDFANKYSFKPLAWDDVSKKITRGEMAEFIYKIIAGIPNKMLAPCADIIKQESDSCSQYENWSLIVDLSFVDTNEEIFSINGYDQGGGNQCASEMADETYPRDIQSTFYDTVIAGSGVKQQVVCNVLCSAWSCADSEPMEEEPLKVEPEIEVEPTPTPEPAVGEIIDKSCTNVPGYGTSIYDVIITGTASAGVGGSAAGVSYGGDVTIACDAWPSHMTSYGEDAKNECFRGSSDSTVTTWTLMGRIFGDQEREIYINSPGAARSVLNYTCP